MAILLDDLTFGYTGKPILRHMSLTLPEAGCVCLFGPSGCGKTTLLRLLAGLERPQGGRIQGVPERVAMVFQEDRLLPWRSVLDNVRMAHPAVTREQAAGVLQDMGLGDELQALPASLSGGMRRRVAIARALAADADLLILDEPFTGLDATRVADVAAYIRQKTAGKPVVMVTHSLDEAAWMEAALCRLPDVSPLTGEWRIGG